MTCPAIPEHRCLDCAPPARGRPFTADGLSRGNPLGAAIRRAAPDPADAVSAFAGHFERVELPRGANLDGVVRIAQPATPSTKAVKKPKPAKPARPRIPVILPR